MIVPTSCEPLVGVMLVVHEVSIQYFEKKSLCEKLPSF